MSDNQTIQPHDPKREAIASLILGIISIMPGIIFLIILLLRCCIAEAFYWHNYIFFSVYIGLGLLVFSAITFLSSIAGLFLGKLGLKSTRKNLAMIGIVLSVLGLGSSIFLFFELIG